MMHQILARFGTADEFNRVATIQVFMSVVGLFWCSYLAMLWRSLWEAQQQLILEKGACESLLSMVCDGIAWVDGDGDTIIRSSPRLNEILGPTWKGRGSPTKFPRVRAQGSGEHSQVAEAMGSSDPPVASLPTTFLR